MYCHSAKAGGGLGTPCTPFPSLSRCRFTCRALPTLRIRADPLLPLRNAALGCLAEAWGVPEAARCHILHQLKVVLRDRLRQRGDSQEAR